MIKKLVSVITGVGAAMIVIVLMESVDMKLYPPPVGVDFKNTEAVKHFVNSLPIEAFLVVLFGYAAGSFVGGVTATIMSGKGRSLYAMVTGIILMLAGFVNLCEIYHPLWFMIAVVFAYIPFAYLGYLVVRQKNVIIE